MHWPRILVVVVFLLFSLSGGTGTAWATASNINVTDGEITIYAPRSTHEVCSCHAERIYTDHRRLGFFHVQLLPLLVAQNVQLKLAEDCFTNDWAQSFLTEWIPFLKHRGIEWRNVTVTVQKTNSPSLHAGRVQPMRSDSAVVCALQDVTLTAGGTTWRTAAAQLCNEGGRPRVVWRADQGEMRWDLLAGEIVPPPNAAPNPAGSGDPAYNSGPAGRVPSHGAGAGGLLSQSGIVPNNQDRTINKETK